MAFDQHAYSREYVKENYSVIRAYILKEDLSKVKEFAKENGMSVSELIISALDKAYGIAVKKSDWRG